MNPFIKYVGLDTHKDTIAVAIAVIAGGKPGSAYVHFCYAMARGMKAVKANGPRLTGAAGLSPDHSDDGYGGTWRS